MPRGNPFDVGFRVPRGKNPFDINLGGINKPKGGRRTLGIRDKQILYSRAKKRCENPYCKKSLEFSEMQVGHKTAASKGGAATLRNSVCLCYSCNKLQGTDSWATFIRKQGGGKTRTVTSGRKKRKRRTIRRGKNSMNIPGLVIPKLNIPKNWGY